MSNNEACENTDREIWRGPDEGNGSYYADSIFITKNGALGINCGGSVYVRPIRDWHMLAGGAIKGFAKPDAAETKAAYDFLVLESEKAASLVNVSLKPS
jgi:hypothetical protein